MRGSRRAAQRPDQPARGGRRRRAAGVLAAAAVTAALVLGLGAVGDPPAGDPDAAAAEAALAAGSGAQVSEVLIEHGGMTRRYLLARPAAGSATPPAVPEETPVVVALHGLGGRPETFASYTGLLELAARGEAVVVVPEGWHPGHETRSWNAGSCCGSARDAGLDDAGFVAAAIADARQRVGVGAGPARVLGFSNGAMLGYRLACTRPDVVAALVAVSGPRTEPDCRPASAVPVLHVHGGRDELVPVTGLTWSALLGTALSTPRRSLAPLASVGGCTGWSRRELPGEVVLRSATGCSDGLRLDVVVVGRLGHRWGRQSERDGLDVTATAERWLAGEPLPAALG
jgi:polyhydroxybutyrate depolymerase